MLTQQQAYDRYQDGETAADKQNLHSTQNISSQFVNYMSNYRVPDSPDTSNLGVTDYAKLTFYKSLLTKTFHVHYGNYNPPAYGSGNTLLVELRQEGSGYLLRYIGFDNVLERHINSPDYYNVNSNSFEFVSGLVGVNFKRLNSKLYNGEHVWVHEMIKDGQITRSYLLPYVLND